MGPTLWERLVWQYCVNAEDKVGKKITTELAGEETQFWFKIEVPALLWLAITVPLPGELPATPTFCATFLFMFSNMLRRARVSRTLDMQCTILDNGASLMSVTLSIPYCLGFSAVITWGLTLFGGLY